MVTPSIPDSPRTAGSQTLDRGLRALELLAEASGPISIASLAEQLGVHRSSAYRVLRTLEDHRFVLRDDAGMVKLGPRLAALGRSAASSLQQAALPELGELANTFGFTTFIAMLDVDRGDHPIEHRAHPRPCERGTAPWCEAPNITGCPRLRD